MILIDVHVNTQLTIRWQRILVAPFPALLNAPYFYKCNIDITFTFVERINDLHQLSTCIHTYNCNNYSIVKQILMCNYFITTCFEKNVKFYQCIYIIVTICSARLNLSLTPTTREKNKKRSWYKHVNLYNYMDSHQLQNYDININLNQFNINAQYKFITNSVLLVIARNNTNVYL